MVGLDRECIDRGRVAVGQADVVARGPFRHVFEHVSSQIW